MRTDRFIRVFLFSAGILLIITAIAKFVAATGHAQILHNTDPVLGISFRNLFWSVGIIEFFVGFISLWGGSASFRVGSVAWLASCFLVYRVGLLLMGYHRPCPCLGNLTDSLHIPAQTADVLMRILLGYLLFGSYASIFSLLLRRRQICSSSPPVSHSSSQTA